MIKLKDSIVQIKPREIAGSISSSRFDYQKDWSLCQLLEYHEKENDYLLLFDYHEDLIIMDSESDPNKVSFFQLKGKKSGNWTLNNLIESEKNKDGIPLLSILGKLYSCKHKFSIETSTLNFISNARFNIKLNDGSAGLSKDKICITELTLRDKEIIKGKLKVEFSLAEMSDFEDIIFLEVTPLSLDDSATHSRGKLSDFLYRIRPLGKFAVSALYQNLLNEVKKRSAYSKEIFSFEELIEKKGIGKKLLNNWLDNLKVDVDLDEVWKRIETALGNDRMPISETRKIKASWTDYELALQNPNNDIVNQISIKVKNIHNSLEIANAFDGLQLRDYLIKILDNYNIDSIAQSVYDINFIKAVILVEIYE